MANFHCRSNSFPTNSHPVVEDAEDQLFRLRSSAATSTSSTSICANLDALTNLHKSIIDLIQMPSVQQVLKQEQGESWVNELVEGSLSLVDLCQFSRDIVCLTKESVQELESSIRRYRGEKSLVDDINAYVASRTNIIKKVNKCIKNLKEFNKNCSPLIGIAKMLKEAEVLGFSVLKSVLTLITEEKGRSNQRSWSLFSMFTHTTRVQVEQKSGAEDFSLDIQRSRKSMDNSTIQKQLKQAEMSIHELEEGLDCFFRSLVKTRATFLNVLIH